MVFNVEIMLQYLVSSYSAFIQNILVVKSISEAISYQFNDNSASGVNSVELVDTEIRVLLILKSCSLANRICRYLFVENTADCAVPPPP